MLGKPQTAAGYVAGSRDLIQATCLYVATKLGDLLDDLVVVGGLVPSLIIDQHALPDGAEQHVGTMDLDIGLAVALLDENRYEDLTERLRQAGFAADTNDAGKTIRQRWRYRGTPSVTVDFLIAPSFPDDRPGTLRSIEADFAAIIAQALPLAFRDRQKITLSGTTLLGEKATRDIWVCGPGAFIVLKAFAWNNRGENKDAYDLYYVVRNFGTGPHDVAAALIPLLDSQTAREAVEYIRRDFLDLDGAAAQRVARFQTGDTDDEIQAEVVGMVGELIRIIDAQTAVG